MGDKTQIEWTRGEDGTPGATWNPVTGCDKVSPGCDHCYAEAIAHRFAGTPAFPRGFEVTLRPDRLTLPLRWTRPRRVFVNSVSDLFHKDVPDAYIARVFAVMALAQQHTFLVLTKRHGRMRSLLRNPWWRDTLLPEVTHEMSAGRAYDTLYPAPNVWLGVSAEDQRWWDVRVPALLETPAAIRFVSAEPILGPIRLHGVSALTRPDWIIAGGESGPHARPMDAQWVRDLRDDATDARIPFFFKQWGGLHPKAGGRVLDGQLWDEMPATVGGVA